MLGQTTERLARKFLGKSERPNSTCQRKPAFLYTQVRIVTSFIFIYFFDTMRMIATQGNQKILMYHNFSKRHT